MCQKIEITFIVVSTKVILFQSVDPLPVGTLRLADDTLLLALLIVLIFQ